MNEFKELDFHSVELILENDIEHPSYQRARKAFLTGGVITNFTLSEVVFSFVGEMVFRAIVSSEVPVGYFQFRYALYDVYRRNREHFVSFWCLKSDWKKIAYCKLRERMKQLFSTYPKVKLEDSLLFKAALRIACATGYSWGTCIMLAENQLDNVELLSVESSIIEGISLMLLEDDSETLSDSDLFD